MKEKCPRCGNFAYDLGTMLECLTCGHFDMESVELFRKGVIEKDEILSMEEKEAFVRTLEMDTDELEKFFEE